MPYIDESGNERDGTPDPLHSRESMLIGMERKPMPRIAENNCAIRELGEVVALIHSELSEALEAHRRNLMDDKLPDRSGIEVEFVDCIIRILDTAAAMVLDVPGAVIAKNRLNKERAAKAKRKNPMWITQWIEVPTTHTTGGTKWVRAKCLLERGRVCAWYEI